MEEWRCFVENKDDPLTTRYSNALSISYWVSNLGNIKIVRNRKDGIKEEKLMLGICRQYKNHGYLAFRIRNKSYRVHRLVAEYFVKGKFLNSVVNHKDNNPLNNKSTNLEWLSIQDNVRFSITNGNRKRKLSENQIVSLRKELYSDTVKNLAKKYKCSIYTIYDIRRNKIYSFPIKK